MNHTEITNFIWNIANLIRDHYRRSKYPDVILPFTVLRRLDCVLAPTKEHVLETHLKFKDRLASEALDSQLRRATQLPPLYRRRWRRREGGSYAVEEKVNGDTPGAIQHLQRKLDADIALQKGAEANPPKTFRLLFDQVVEERFAEMIDNYFEFYRKVTDDPKAKERLFDWLFGEYRRRKWT